MLASDRYMLQRYFSRDYLTHQGKQLAPYFLTDVHCHRKMMYFYEYFCFPEFWRVSARCWISHKLFPITCFSPKCPVIHAMCGALAASISWDCVCSLTGKLKLLMKTWMSLLGNGPFCVSVAIAMCVCVFSVTACKSPQSSSNSDEFICTSVLFISSPCMKIVTKYFCVQEWEKWNTWVILGYLSRYCRKANISLLLHLLHSSWRREVLYLCSEVGGVFSESKRAEELPLLVTADLRSENAGSMVPEENDQKAVQGLCSWDL